MTPELTRDPLLDVHARLTELRELNEFDFFWLPLRPLGDALSSEIYYRRAQVALKVGNEMLLVNFPDVGQPLGLTGKEWVYPINGAEK